MKSEKFTESIQESLLHILSDIEKEDKEGLRAAMIRECKQNEYYWHGFQHIFWDVNTQDYRIPTHEALNEISSRAENKYSYDVVVNTFKAHGLSIIAALSAEIPAVPFSPMDADSARDVLAANKAEELGKIIQKHNKAKMLFYHALFTLYTSHYVCSYNFYERDEKYGTIEVPKYENKKNADTYTCANCGFSSEQELTNCPDCDGPLTKTEGITGPMQTGVEEINKGMEKLTILGAAEVKIPLYAADQDAIGYLIHYSDQHYALLRNLYKEVDRNEISSKGKDDYERQNRIPYGAEDKQDLITLKKIWLRPWMFDSLDEDKAKELHKKFPKGVYFASIESGKDVFADAREEKLDDHWTVQKGDLSRAIHGDPLGKPLIPLQDLENMVMNLLPESLEHSIPSTFADPAVLDFERYSEQEVLPGAVYPIKNSINPNQRLEDFFFTLKTSTLPKEGVDFNKVVESKGQFVVGAFPSIFGGPQTSGSKTLGEYQESRNYALQRLSIPYQLLFFWWADTIYKGVRDYIDNMISDEKHTVKVQNGKFASISLLMDDFSLGRFSTLIPESSVDLPVSFSQKRSTLESMIQLNSDTINQLLFSPENRRTTLRFLGLEELNDLDSNQTMKQLLELDELLKSEPTQNEMGEEISSIPIEIEIDDDEIHLRVLKTYLSSPLGQENKKVNPAGYMNALLHAREHELHIRDLMMQESQLGQSQEAPIEEGETANVEV